MANLAPVVEKMANFPGSDRGLIQSSGRTVICRLRVHFRKEKTRKKYQSSQRCLN